MSGAIFYLLNQGNHMNILPNTIIVFPDSFDSMKQFNLELKYSDADYAIYHLGEREHETIQDRLVATGIPYIYIPETLNQSISVVSYIKLGGNIVVNTKYIPLLSVINFNPKEMDTHINNTISKEQSKLGNKYSIVQLLSED